MDRIFYVKSAKLRIKDAQEDKIVRARLLRMPLDREKRVVTEPLRLVTKLLESNKKVLKCYLEESRVSTIFNPTIISSTFYRNINRSERYIRTFENQNRFQRFKKHFPTRDGKCYPMIFLVIFESVIYK